MLNLLRTKDGLLTVAAWFAIWLMLEMVFFGEPMFRYSASGVGYQFYLLEIALVSVFSIALGASPRMMSAFCRRLTKPPMAIAASGLSSLSLFLIRFAVDPAFPLAPEPFLLVSTVCFVATAVPLTCLWAERTMDLVFEHGLRPVLASILLGIALSFLLVPRFLRDTAYGIAVVGLTPGVLGGTLVAVGAGATAQVGRRQTDEGDDDGGGSAQPLARRYVVMSLGSLAVFSLLVYLISYFDFVVPAGFRVVVDENPYYYLAIFILIGILAATLAVVGNERELTARVFLLILFGLMMLSLLVFFGVLSYAFEGGDYMYELTKLLRRIVKIAMLYVLVILIYQNALPAGRTFALVIVAPLVLAKLIQMVVVTIPDLHALVTGHQYVYFSSIGFLSIVTWSLILISCVQGNTLLYGAAESEGVAQARPSGQETGQDEQDEPAGKKAVREAVGRYGLTEREADVFAYLCAGHSLRAISGALCVSQNTVKTHVSAIYRKTGLHSRQEIIDLMSSWPG